MSAAHDLSTYCCSTLGKGTLGTNWFVNDLPSSPDNCGAVFEYGGGASDMGMASADSDALENVDCQIDYRHTNAATAQSTAYSIYKSLDGLAAVTINSVAYLFIRAKQPPFLLMHDGNNRTTFVFNVHVQKRRS